MLVNMLPVVLIVAAFAVQYVVQSSIVRRYDYRCDTCGSVFSLPPLAASLAPHRMGQKWVRCPSCGVRSWAAPIPRAHDI
jgi:DNA-directed RNA polymerase subunit RPC12/RpoP